MNEYFKLESENIRLKNENMKLKRDVEDYLSMIRRYHVNSRIGLPDTYPHYTDINKNKTFISYNDTWGWFIRQIQTPEGLVYDVSVGQSFYEFMLLCGYRTNAVGLFTIPLNFDLFIEYVEALPDGRSKVVQQLKDTKK